MFRYVALMWGAKCPAQCAVALELVRRLQAASCQWVVKFEAGGVQVLAADMSPHLSAYPLQHGAGVVLGEIFERETDLRSDAPMKHAVFGERETDEVLATQGRSLVAGHWGNYVAFVIDARAHLRWVVNDPTGPLPCYVMEHRGVRVFFSCLGDIRDLACMRFTVNWSFVRSRTVNGIYDVETDCFAGISRVHRGECVSFDERGGCMARRFYWHPSTFPGADHTLEEPEIAERHFAQWCEV